MKNLSLQNSNIEAFVQNSFDFNLTRSWNFSNLPFDWIVFKSGWTNHVWIALFLSISFFIFTTFFNHRLCQKKRVFRYDIFLFPICDSFNYWNVVSVYNYFYVHKTWLTSLSVFIIRFFNRPIDLKIVGGNFSEQIFSEMFNVAKCGTHIKVSGWTTSILLCCKFSSSRLFCRWKISAWSSHSSLFFKLKTLRLVKDLNESLFIFLNRFSDKSKFVSFVMLSNSSCGKLTSWLFSNWRIRRHLKLFMACGWITNILLLLKFNSSKLDWCWNIFWQMILMLFWCSEIYFSCFRGRKVSQWTSFNWLFWRLNFSRFPGPMKASLSILASGLLSIVTCFRINDLRNSFGGSSVSWLLLKFTYCSWGKSESTSDESSVKPDFSKFMTDKFWNLRITSHGMVLNWCSWLMCKYFIFCSLMFFVLIITTSVPREILHESLNFAWL